MTGDEGTPGQGAVSRIFGSELDYTLSRNRFRNFFTGHMLPHGANGFTLRESPRADWQEISGNGQPVANIVPNMPDGAALPAVIALFDDSGDGIVDRAAGAYYDSDGQAIFVGFGERFEMDWVNDMIASHGSHMTTVTFTPDGAAPARTAAPQNTPEPFNGPLLILQMLNNNDRQPETQRRIGGNEATLLRGLLPLVENLSPQGQEALRSLLDHVGDRDYILGDAEIADLGNLAEATGNAAAIRELISHLR